MKDDQISSIDSFEKALKYFESYKRNGKLFFRGQLTKYLFMDPTIVRDKYGLEQENDIYEQNYDKNKTALQNLAYMQHSGIHTRLLDFSTDPLVSLFFAVNNNERKDSSVYVFIRNGFCAKSIEVKLMSFIPTIKSRYIPVIVKKFNKKYNENLDINTAVHILSHDLFIKPNTLSDASNRRMKEQKGTFAFPANVIKDNKIIGTKHFEDTKSYKEIIIPFEFQQEIFNRLKEENYSSLRLYGSKKYDRKVANIGIRNLETNLTEHFSKVNSNKGKDYVVTNILLKKKEIERVGYQLAQKHDLDKLTIWFQREYKQNGVNIVNQFWSQRGGISWWNTENGKKCGNFKFREDWGDSYIINRIFYDYPELFKKRKILPESPNAMRIKMDISLVERKIKIDTNLFAGAKLFITGKNIESDITIKEDQTSYYIDISNLKKKIIKGSVILLAPSLQNKSFLEKTGIDFENLTGDFIKRSNKLNSFIHGEKEFCFLLKNC